MMRAGVLCAVHTAREPAIVAAIDAPGTGAQVVRRCADLTEVVALALAGVGRVAVLAAGIGGLDRAAVARLREAGARVVVLADVDDLERCRSLGADAVLDAGSPPGEVVREVQRCAAEAADSAPPAGAGDPAGASGGDDGAPSADPAPARGRLVAVWGPHGSPGRTTLAVNLAAELSARGGGALVVDADTWGGSVAQSLGLLDESPGLAAAARAAANGTLDVATLGRLCPVVEHDLRVLTGLSRPDRWRELAPAALDYVWDTVRDLAPWTVVDCGFSLEDEAGAGFEAMLGPRRNGATLSALAAADVAVVVGAGEPVGIQRLVQGLQELAEAGLPPPGVRRLVVVNRVRAAAAGPMPERAVTDALVRYAGVGDPFVIPDDRPALDRAMLDGATLATSAPTSPVRAAIGSLADHLAGSRPDRRPHRRRGRLTAREPRSAA